MVRRLPSNVGCGRSRSSATAASFGTVMATAGRNMGDRERGARKMGERARAKVRWRLRAKERYTEREVGRE